MAKYTSIGGQALIEGIMMKNPQKKTAMAVRKPDKTIDISFIEHKSIKDKIKIFKLPVLRGIVTYIETMIQGYKAMMKSADISGFTDIEEEKDKPKDEKKAICFYGGYYDRGHHTWYRVSARFVFRYTKICRTGHRVACWHPVFKGCPFGHRTTFKACSVGDLYVGSLFYEGYSPRVCVSRRRA